MYIFTLILLGLYVSIVLLVAFMSLRPRLVSPTNFLWTLIWSMFILIFSVLHIRTGHLYSLTGIAIGLFGYSSVALRNAQHLGQRPQLKHHLIRSGIHVVFLILLYFTR